MINHNNCPYFCKPNQLLLIFFNFAYQSSSSRLASTTNLVGRHTTCIHMMCVCGCAYMSFCVQVSAFSFENKRLHFARACRKRASNGGTDAYTDLSAELVIIDFDVVVVVVVSAAAHIGL